MFKRNVTPFNKVQQRQITRQITTTQEHRTHLKQC